MNDPKCGYILCKVSPQNDLDDVGDVISAKDVERIDELAQSAQCFMHQAEEVMDYIHSGISMGYFSKDCEISAITEMTQRATKHFVATEVTELVGLTMKLGRIATEAKCHVDK